MELAPTNPPLADSETVLVAEPDVLVRLMICHYLRECGYRVVEAANAHEAVTILASPDMHIAILLCVGFALARWARSKRAGIDVILAGNETRTADAVGQLCEEGPMMKKPYDHKLLADRIKRMLATRGRK
jgi:DNA-binding response OmpR family regulator